MTRVDILKSESWSWYESNSPVIDSTVAGDPKIFYRNLACSVDWEETTWCLVDQLRDWFDEQQIGYEVRIEQVAPAGTSPRLWNMWFEIDRPAAALMFKLTWGGRFCS